MKINIVLILLYYSFFSPGFLYAKELQNCKHFWLTETKEIISDNIRGNEIGFVSLIDKKIVGYTHLNFKPHYREDVVTEGSLVLPYYSGQGIGSALKKKCVEEAFKQKILKFVAWVHEGNWISFLNAKNNGFLIAGIYFNEEKIHKNSKYMIYFERPIL